MHVIMEHTKIINVAVHIMYAHVTNIYGGGVCVWGEGGDLMDYRVEHIGNDKLHHQY